MRGSSPQLKQGGIRRAYLMIKTIDCNNLKFRGLEYKTDKVIAGDTVLIKKGEVSIIFDADGNPHEMLPDSVKQFLFTDRNGNEIYAGDYIGCIDGSPSSIEADYGMEFRAELWELREPNYDF